MAAIWVSGEGPATECDGCSGMIEGRGLRVDGFELCGRCVEEHSCEYCGEYSKSLHTLEWDIPATWAEPGDNGSAVLCLRCFDKFTRRRA